MQEKAESVLKNISSSDSIIFPGEGYIVLSLVRRNDVILFIEFTL